MKGNSRRTQRGFTLIQLLTVIAIMGVITTFGVLGIRNARAEFRMQSSARLFATYVEKARVDAIRRHAQSGDESSVETFGPGTTTYAVSMDWGSGVVETKVFDLDSGLTFATAAKKVSFDWRGRISEAWVFQIFSTYLGESLPVDVSGSGDITVGEQHFPDQLIPDITISEVTNDVATPNPTIAASPSPTTSPSPSQGASPSPSPTASLGPGNSGTNGGGSGSNNGNGNSSPTPTPAASPSPSASADPNASPSPALPQCASVISPNYLELSQSNTAKQSGSATFTMTNATGAVRVISATQAGNGNSVNIALSLQRIDGNGSSVVTVSTKKGAGNRGTFLVNVSASPSCGTTQQLKVFISN
jgi:prepilin-type N-terminal cleavage/methylation domain-containing protein